MESAGNLDQNRKSLRKFPLYLLKRNMAFHISGVATLLLILFLNCKSGLSLGHLGSFSPSSFQWAREVPSIPFLLEQLFLTSLARTSTAMGKLHFCRDGEKKKGGYKPCSNFSVQYLGLKESTTVIQSWSASHTQRLGAVGEDESQNSTLHEFHLLQGPAVFLFRINRLTFSSGHIL